MPGLCIHSPVDDSFPAGGTGLAIRRCPEEKEAWAVTTGAASSRRVIGPTEGVQRKWGAQSAVAPLRRALLCPPRWSEATMAGIDLGVWGYASLPRLGEARAEFEALAEVLVRAGVEVLRHEEAQDGIYDAVFACDWGLVVNDGGIVLNPGKPARRPEADFAERAFLRAGVPIYHRMTAPATAEGGDLLWLGPDLLLVGRSYRTNAAGLDELQALLAPRGISVAQAPVPHWEGQGSVMHLLSIISLVDSDLAVVYLPLLAVETVEFLRERGVEFLPVTGEEFGNLACNILALGPRHCLAVAGNPRVRRELERRGATVEEFPDRQLGLNMGGGPTCLVQAVLRDY